MEHLSIQTLVLNADQFEAEERTPFAEMPWASSSEVIWQQGDVTAPILRNGRTFEYFLEPSIILELKEQLSSLDSASLVNRVIQYAENDA
jgi:hypothetical protein